MKENEGDVNMKQEEEEEEKKSVPSRPLGSCASSIALMIIVADVSTASFDVVIR